MTVTTDEHLTPSSEEADAIRGAVAAKVGAITSRGFAFKVVEFSEVDGRAILEGDIDVGTAEAATAMLDELQHAGSRAEAHAAVVSDRDRLWPGGVMPIVKPPGGALRNLVQSAVQAIEARTNVRFPERSAEADFVRFEAADYSSSPVGRVGGGQTIKLAPTATTGTAIHELCHSLGLWHEQSREDRDSFVRIHWQNIRDGYEHNFRQHISDGDDFGEYDYDSIMHYPAEAFSRNGQSTITPVIGDPRIGQRFRLSEGDIRAINTLYPTATQPAAPLPREPPNPDRPPLQGYTRTFTTEVGSRGTARVSTGGWPADRAVDWRLLPTIPSALEAPQLSWQVELSVDARNELVYYFTIENQGGDRQTVEAWHRFL